MEAGPVRLGSHQRQLIQGDQEGVGRGTGTILIGRKLSIGSTTARKPVQRILAGLLWLCFALIP